MSSLLGFPFARDFSIEAGKAQGIQAILGTRQYPSRHKAHKDDDICIKVCMALRALPVQAMTKSFIHVFNNNTFVKNEVALLQSIAPEISRTTLRQLSQVVYGMLISNGRITMLELSRWGGERR
jgi:hypothetical protein